MDNLNQNLVMTDVFIDAHYLTAASIRLSEESLIDFVEEAWDIVEPGIQFIASQHVKAICDHLQAVTRGEIIDLVINCPPGMSKSRIVSVLWPAWVWTTSPGKRFLFASYEQQLATRDSVTCRQLIASRWYQERWGHHVHLKGDDNMKTKFVNQAGGWRMATTPRGRGTGEHPDFVVADDPHNVRQAESEIERQHVLNWWDRTITTRGASRRSRRVVVAQRLHERDLSGHILVSRPWAVHLMIPMEFDPALDKPTPWWKDSRSTEGEPLCSALIPVDEVERMKLIMGSKASGQLQQNPLPDEGAILSRSMFKSFDVDSASGESWSEEIYTLHLPDGQVRRYAAGQCCWFQTADTAEKDGEGNDYTCIGTFALTPGGELLVYDIIREKIKIPRLYPLMIEQRSKYQNRLLCQAVEDKSSGTGLIQMGFERATPFLPLKMKGSKQERAVPMATWYSGGRIFHKTGAIWRQMLEDELVGFPDALHDDQWDMVAYAVQLLHQGLLSQMANKGRKLLVWPSPEDVAEMTNPMYDPEDYSGREFDLARQLGII